MKKRYLLGIDIGTSGYKVTAFGFDGSIAGSAAGTYNTYYPKPGYVEQDATDWWHAACSGIKKLIEDHGVDPKEIAAIGVDGTSWACLPVEEGGNPLRRAMIWLDRRSKDQAKEIIDKIDEEALVEICGNPVDPAYIVPKMLWILENEPDIYKRTYKFIQSNAYIILKLTGKYSQDYSQGYGFHFFDITKGTWNKDIASRLGISLELLSPIFHCHDIVGEVTEKAASETGLAAGIPVVAGGLDAACCSLGAGVIKPGQTQEQGGQAGGMSILVDKPLIHRKLILGYHVIPGKWLLQGGTVGGGGTLRWFNEQLGEYYKYAGVEKAKNSYEAMSQEAGTVQTGSGGLIFLPYMAGERSPIWDTRARGVFFGLSYDKTRAHMIRAMMEGVGYSLLHNLKTAEEAGAVAENLLSVGGSANSRVWTQIKADITGRTIYVLDSDNATTLGAAILAGVGAGVYKDFQDAVASTVHIRRVHKPDERKHLIYGKYYKLYIELYNRLKDCFSELYDISESI